MLHHHVQKREIKEREMSNKLVEKIEVLNAAQAARYCGLSQPSLRRELPNIAHRRAGRRVLIRRAALDAWLEGEDAEVGGQR